MRIVVTGGAGFIGSHIVDRLVKEHVVCVIDDMSGGYARNLNKKTSDFFMVDCRNFDAVDQIFADFKPEIVYHLAANAAENKAQFSPIDVTSRNYSSFLSVLTAGLRHGMKRIVVTSSIAVYGAITPPFGETDTPEPEDLYGLSKLEMEKTLQIMSKVHPFEYVITRPHNVYGPRQDMGDPYRNVMTIFMNQILKGQPFFIYGDGEQRRCFSYIDGVADAITKCGFLPVDKQIFNVGSDKSYSLNQLADTIIKVTGASLRPIYLNDRPNEVKIAESNHDKAKELLNYEDAVTFEQGVLNTWKYARKLGPQPVRRTGFEIDSPLIPLNWK